MFAFINTEEKSKFTDNNELHIEKKRKERNFKIFFAVLAFSLLNLALYLLTKIS
ncbi:MAG TPA: hypothetical protein VF270_02730 [Ignavibacteriaceae bacterium]|jgi:hypothetical protein